MSIMKPIRKPEITVKDIGGETLLYSTKAEVIHVLNATAKLIWELCDGEHTVEDIERVIRSSFAVADDYNVAADIQRTLQVFADKELLQKTT